jgi:outer membrane protein assembly factor BamE (lipoprotein component of BamABCDE complex)
MKKILLVLSIFVFVGFFCVGCKKTPNEVLQDTEAESNQGAKEVSEDLVIRPGIGVGKIKFGMTVKQMKDILGKPDVAATGISYMYSELGIEIVAKDTVTISTIYCGNPHGKTEPIIKAMEKACKFKTAEGLGIGSTESQIVKLFGEPSKRRGNQLIYKNKRMAFFLTDDKVIGIILMK